MKECRKCHTQLVIGENISQGMFNHSDYICRSCSYANTRKNKFKNPKYKEWNNKYNKSAKGKQCYTKWSTQWGSGIYGIFENGECLYVGESSTLRKRISAHLYGIQKPESFVKKPFYYTLYNNINKHLTPVIGILEETPNHKEREQYWISKLKPKYNE